MYYDPILDVHHRVSVAAALTTAFYAAPQAPADARRLFEAGYTSLGLDRSDPRLPLRPSRAFGSSLLLAREWSIPDLERRLVDAIEASYEPTWDQERGEHTWGMGLDEEHPRGQFNAFLAAAEAAGPGAWERLSAGPLEPCPQVVGVDFPEIALDRAEWIGGALYLGLRPLRENPRAITELRVVGAEPRVWYLSGIDGATMDVTGRTVIIRVPKVRGTLEMVPGSY